MLIILLGLNYLVKGDDEGLLRWARNNELVDTVDELWEDSGTGSGIIPSHDKGTKPTVYRRTSFDAGVPTNRVSSPSISTSSSFPASSGNPVTSWIKKNVTPTGIMNSFIRRTIRKDTWIYVAVCPMPAREVGAYMHLFIQDKNCESRMGRLQ